MQVPAAHHYYSSLMPFTLFRSDYFQQVKAENPGLTIPQLKKLLTDRWNNLDAVTKSSYEKLAEEVYKGYQSDAEAMYQVIIEQAEKEKAKYENIEEESTASNPQ